VTVAFSRPTGIQVVSVSDVTFLPVAEVARLRDAGVLPTGKSPWNGDCAPRQLGFKRSNFNHNPQTGPRGGVVLKTKYTEGGWPVFGKMRGGQQRFVEDWNADGSRWAETHNRVNTGAAKHELAEEKMPEMGPELGSLFSDGQRNKPFDRNVPDLPDAPDPMHDQGEYKEHEKYEQRVLDGEFEDYKQHGSETTVEAKTESYGAPAPVEDKGSDNGNGSGRKGTYSELLRRTSSKSPTRSKLRVLKLYKRGYTMDGAAKKLGLPRAKVRSWYEEVKEAVKLVCREHRLSEDELLRQVGSQAEE
jgi:hypothetical protein